MTANQIDQSVLYRQRPGEPPPRTVLVTKAVLHADRRNTLGEPPATCDGVRRIVGMPQFADMHPLDFLFAPAEERGPGGIYTGEVAVEIGHAEQVFGDMPDPIAFPDALGNF